jgi:RNA polymerase sigma factor (sigma-70 family)
MDKKKQFIATVQKNEALIYKVAGFYVSNLHDREDLVQEIIYQMWKSFDSFNNKSSVTTWMYRVAMNTAIYFLKKDKRKVTVQSLEKEALEYPESEYAETEERLKAMHSYISELNLLEKGIVMLHLEGKSYEEIGSLVGISTSNVGTRLSRIKEKLKKQVAKTN